MSNIFTMPKDEIGYDDVVSFCSQKVKEGMSLDYKRDFPSELEKTISAFGNTFGGIIIIGVEDDDSKPKPPYQGIGYKEGLEEKVQNIILDNIYPPIFPEITVCPPKDGKTFVVIRVPQSNETPHAIHNEKRVYIRTGNRNKPEDLATVGRIEWLTNKRKKSEEMRELLYSRAKERYQNICKSRNVEIKFAELTLSFAPLYPQKPLMSVDEIRTICNEIKVAARHGEKFPRLEDPLAPVQDGMASFYSIKNNSIKGDSISYTEINRFGLVYHKRNLGYIGKSKETSMPQKQLLMYHIVGKIDLALEAMSNFCGRRDCGLVEVKISLEKLLGVYFIPLSASGEEHIIDNEQELSWKRILSVAELNDTMIRQEKLLDLGKDIAWAFGVENSIETIKKNLKERGRWQEVR